MDGNRLKLLLQRSDNPHHPAAAARRGEIEFV
jgi:hypothetical protein